MIRILIVEDDENISKMLAATLSIGDYEYDRCADGEEAVQTILNGTYDLILLDVMLPGMDGFAVLRAAAAGRFYAGADADRPRRRAGSRAGAEPGRGLLTCPSPLNAASWWPA